MRTGDLVKTCGVNAFMWDDIENWEETHRGTFDPGEIGMIISEAVSSHAVKFAFVLVKERLGWVASNNLVVLT